MSSDARSAGAVGRALLWPVLGMGAVILVLHVGGLALLLGTTGAAVRPTVLGLGLTAYTLGLRHAFDADHIAAIDNTTRKLVNDSRSPISVGFWFSLGHSSVVLGLILALTLGARVLVGPVTEENSPLHQITGIVGTSVSAVFLYAIAGVNLFSLLSGLRSDRTGSAEDVRPGGPLVRLFGRAVSSIRRPGQMYPLGVLFGLGFDTATEIGLLAIAATSSAAGVAWYTVLALPLLFAAGMSLLDTSDGVLMRFAYSWASGAPRRRSRYNLTVTALSVSMALIVGTIQLINLLGGELGLEGAMWSWVRGVDLTVVGIGIVALLLLVWCSAVVVAPRARTRREREETAER
ncbi:HoxN/HupN/NixA family nickel/cobalt transporter [Leifsonia sp. RAF41]|uniref:HoxN/HupN/NixA family nickel/cobalt transporter n=1 Tax=Leifsonia sp. RAF41 TaxID=3233056 RepID=UPI003F9E6A94